MRLPFPNAQNCPFEKPKKIPLVVLLSLLILLLSACQPSPPACPPESVTYLLEEDASKIIDAQNTSAATEQLVEINGQEIWVDQVVQGTLCSGSWSGTVYVPCKVQVYAWEEDPLFLEDCDLSIAPGTVIYVAAHNDQPYYQGCSCHTGDE